MGGWWLGELHTPDQFRQVCGWLPCHIVAAIQPHYRHLLSFPQPRAPHICTASESSPKSTSNITTQLQIASMIQAPQCMLSAASAGIRSTPTHVSELLKHTSHQGKAARGLRRLEAQTLLDPYQLTPHACRVLKQTMQARFVQQSSSAVLQLGLQGTTLPCNAAALLLCCCLMPLHTCNLPSSRS